MRQALAFLAIFAPFVGCLSAAYPDDRFIPRQPRGSKISEVEWNRLVEQLEKYPMKIKKPAMKQIVVRFSPNAAALFSDAGWKEFAKPRRYDENMCAWPLINADGKHVSFGLAVADDAYEQLSLTIESTGRVVTVRDSTWTGSASFPIPGASFVFNHGSVPKAPRN
ncbi:MAG TPA: hypothetical protein VM182_00265 [Terriglobia bacterium]|nr:hypothetical protein [Terriglobia bacterium]